MNHRTDCSGQGHESVARDDRHGLVALVTILERIGIESPSLDLLKNPAERTHAAA
ncbi:MAG: hypothetical protein R3C53_19580 [Pirellulaceae bacterium]